MNKNVVISVIGVLVLLLIGYFLFRDGGMWATNSGNVATTTPTPSPVTPTPSAPVTNTVKAPEVMTGQNGVPSNSSIVVTGTVVPNGAPTTYWYEYGLTSSLGSKTTVQSIGSGFNRINTPGYITGLGANKTYYYRLVAQNRLGTVSGTTYSVTTNNDPAPTGSIPSVNTNNATSITRTTADLNGQMNPKGANSNYWFEYGLDTNFGNVTSFEATGSGTSASPVSARITGLAGLTKYYYRLNAQNQFGTVNGATMSFTTLGPASPSAPTVDTTSAGSIATSSVSMSGDLTPNGAQTTYWFEYSEDSLLGSILGTVTESQVLAGDKNKTRVTVVENGLNRNTKYFYRLVARNQYGTVEGDILSFTTKK